MSVDEAWKNNFSAEVYVDWTHNCRMEVSAGASIQMGDGPSPGIDFNGHILQEFFASRVEEQRRVDGEDVLSGDADWVV
jgi:hypothetical protein